MREIKPQVIRAHKTAGLVNVFTQHFFQSRLHQMGGGVVGCGFEPSRCIHGLHQVVTGFQNPILQLHRQDMLTVADLRDICDLGFHLLVEQPAGISHLTAAGGIEAALVQDNLAFVLQRIHQSALPEQTDNLRRRLQDIVSDELTGLFELHQIFVLCRKRFLCIACIPGSFLLLLHLGIKFRTVNRQAVFIRYLSRKFVRESIGVIETEHDFAWKPASSGSFLHCVIQETLPGLQGPAERLFFLQDPPLCLFCVLSEVGIEILHHRIHDRNQLIQERFVHSQLQSEPCCSAKDTAEHISSAGVGE